MTLVTNTVQRYCCSDYRQKQTLLPTHVSLYHVNGIRYGAVVLLEQIRTIDTARLGDYIGKLNEEEMLEVEKSLAISFGMTMKK